MSCETIQPGIKIRVDRKFNFRPEGTIKLAVDDVQYGRYQGAYLTPAQALQAAAVLITEAAAGLAETETA